MAFALCKTLPFASSRGTVVSKRAGRRSVTVQARGGGGGGTVWDPDGIFKTGPQEGLIERKLMGQRISSDQEYKEQVTTFMETQKAERQQRRDERVTPSDPYDLVEYFLDTEADEMEYEVARCRPSLGKDFFLVMDKLVGVQRLSTEPDEDRLAELETLRQYLEEAVEALDKSTAAVAAAPEKLKKLLTSKDKKATLLEMAGAGEIDQALFDVLDQNIEGAKAAKQEEAAEFMTKVKQAAMRYLIKA